MEGAAQSIFLFVMRHNSTLQFRIQLVVIIILSMCDLNNILKNCGVQRSAVLKLFNKLRLQRSLRTKNTGAAEVADIICVSATSLLASLVSSEISSMCLLVDLCFSA